MVKCRKVSGTMRGHLIGKTKYRMKYCKLSTYSTEGLSKLKYFTGVSVRGGFGWEGG